MASTILALSAQAQSVTLNDVAKAVEMILVDTKEYQTKTDAALQKRDQEIAVLRSEIKALKSESSFASVEMAPHAQVGEITVSPAYTHFSKGNLNVRQSASIFSPVVATLKPGERVSVSALDNAMAYIGNGWCSVKYLVTLPKETH
jgi:uncharacterized protein YgiM (DUF1202 family)